MVECVLRVMDWGVRDHCVLNGSESGVSQPARQAGSNNAPEGDSGIVCVGAIVVAACLSFVCVLACVVSINQFRQIIRRSSSSSSFESTDMLIIIINGRGAIGI
jgi:hypothetical protein